jgi:DNA (cytosine-5)-methyltransferase 1
MATPHRTRLPGDLATPAIIDLFAGIGCVADGFAEQGFRVAALVDIDPDARDNYLHNRPDANYLLTDLATLGDGELATLGDGSRPTGVVGCPPCQGFSAAGARRRDDPRNRLLTTFFRAVDLLEPDFFVMENVPSVVYEPALGALLAERKSAWATVRGILNSACYGLPQTRQRAIVIGYRRELGMTPTLPEPTHFGTRAIFDYRTGMIEPPELNRLESLLGESPHIGVPQSRRIGMRELLPDDSAALLDLVTVGDALADLPPLDSGEPALPSAYAEPLRNGATPNHVRWGHRPELVARLDVVPEGGRLATTKRYYSQAYARLHRQGLARTVTTNFHNAGCGRFTHYAEPRTLTVREAARLQGIKDEFEFIGHQSVQERLVGNAFPRLWAAAVAKHVATELSPALASVRPPL